MMERCSYSIADRGYDNCKMIAQLWGGYGIKPLIGMGTCERMGRSRRRRVERGVIITFSRLSKYSGAHNDR